MIIQIRGTSGSGKTWVMREVMKRLPGMDTRTPVYVEKRKRPLYYLFDNRIAVLGSYEAACGGCDTIGSARVVFETIQALPAGIETIICEGLLLSEDVKWTIQLPDLRALFLSTPLETCLKQIGERRKEAGNDKPLNTANTSNRISTIERARVKLINAGVFVRRCSANQAPEVVLNWLRLHAE